MPLRGKMVAGSLWARKMRVRIANRLVLVTIIDKADI
jgi:hypothetical protein